MSFKFYGSYCTVYITPSTYPWLEVESFLLAGGVECGAPRPFSLVRTTQGGVAGGVIMDPLDKDSVMDGGERVEQPGEGGGAEELLLTLDEVLSAGLER